MDAPLHYIDRGYDIASVNLEKCIGEAAVIELSGDENPEKLTELLKDLPKRILIKKGGELTAQTARTLADCGVVLIGVEDMSVGERFGDRNPQDISRKRYSCSGKYNS